MDLHKGVYNRIVAQHNDGRPLSFTLTTHSDAPPGSGLGSSSTLVVSMVQAFVEWLNWRKASPTRRSSVSTLWRKPLA